MKSELYAETHHLLTNSVPQVTSCAMNSSRTKTVIALSLPFLLCLSMESWAVKRGPIAMGPAYAAVIGLEGCSAVVIHPRAFLTAGHCNSHIYRGSNTVYFPNRDSSSRVEIKDIFINEGYEENEEPGGKFKINDDIALVVLSEPIQEAAILANIPNIIDEKSLNQAETLTAVGLGMYKTWGTSYLGDWDNSDKHMAPYRLEQKNVSVDYLKAQTPGVGICGGDSGGALLRVSPDGKKSELVGILTATGGECGGSDQTDYAESVSSHLDWIKKNLQKEEISLP